MASSFSSRPPPPPRRNPTTMPPSSSSRPPWVILGSVPDLMDELPPGFEYKIRIPAIPPPRVSLLAIPRSIIPSAITHQDPNNPTILAVDPSGDILLLHVVIRRAESNSPITVRLPGRSTRIVRREFVTSCFVLDAAADSVVTVPNAALLLNPANAGIIYSPTGAGRYAVAELQFDEGAANGKVTLLSFASHVGDWVSKPLSIEPPPRSFHSDCVLSHDGRLWWVDLSLGIVACDPFADSPVLTVIQLPPSKMLDQTEEHLHRRRLVRVSDGKLRFVDMYSSSDGLKVSVCTLQAYPDSATSNSWSSYEASFRDIWAHQSYRATGMPKQAPILKLIDPYDPFILYFFLKERMFGVDLRTHNVVGCESVAPTNKELVSSRFLHAWLRPTDTSINSEVGPNKEGLKCGNQSAIQVTQVDEIFGKLYLDRRINRHTIKADLSNSHVGQHGQTMQCASLAMEHYNNTKNTDYQIDMSEPRDRNAFHLTQYQRFEAQSGYFHVNFFARNSTGEKQLFFAELNGVNGPINVSEVITLGYDENSIEANSAEHICIYCTGILHPCSGSFKGMSAEHRVRSSTSLD